MRSILALGAAFPLLLVGDSLPAIRSVTFAGGTPHVTLATQVGRPYDAALIHEDVERLWRTGKFHDICRNPG